MQIYWHFKRLCIEVEISSPVMDVNTFNRAGWMDGTCVGGSACCDNGGASCVVVGCSGSGA